MTEKWKTNPGSRSGSVPKSNRLVFGKRSKIYHPQNLVQIRQQSRFESQSGSGSVPRSVPKSNQMFLQ